MAANFLHSADLGSDSDDSDYVPDAKDNEGLSEEEDGGEVEEEDGSEGIKKKTKKKTVGKGKKGPLPERGALFREDDAEASERSKEFAKEKEEKKEEDEKKKVDDLWADFKKDVDSKPKPVRSGSGLGSLTSQTSKPVSLSSGGGTVPQQPRSIVSSIFEKLPESSSTKVEAAAPQCVSTSEKEDSEEQKVKITTVFDFAGESVSVTKEVEKDSKEAKKHQLAQEQQTAQKRPGGLSSIMNVIAGKKKKMGCLDKSKLDWDSFVRQEGIKEDLEIHNKGKEGYVEKQAFLERADLRRFELEKEARDKTRKSFNK